MSENPPAPRRARHPSAPGGSRLGQLAAVVALAICLPWMGERVAVLIAAAREGTGAKDLVQLLIREGMVLMLLGGLPASALFQLSESRERAERTRRQDILDDHGRALIMPGCGMVLFGLVATPFLAYWLARYPPDLVRSMVLAGGALSAGCAALAPVYRALVFGGARPPATWALPPGPATAEPRDDPRRPSM